MRERVLPSIIYIFHSIFFRSITNVFNKKSHITFQVVFQITNRHDIYSISNVFYRIRASTNLFQKFDPVEILISTEYL